MKRLLTAVLIGLTLPACTDPTFLGSLISVEGGRTFSGRVTGSSAANPNLRVLVVPGVASDPTSSQGQVVDVAGGTFTLQVSPDRSRQYTVFAFIDANANGRYDSGEASTFGATRENTYYQLSWNGTDWVVTELSSSGSATRPTETARLDITFNA